MAVFVLTVVGLMLAASAVNAEQVNNYRMCPNTDCLVYDLFIDPCPQAVYNQACQWTENSNTSIAFKYNPDFGSNIPVTQLYAETFLMDLPFLDIDTNACLYTNCPVMKNTEQNWLFNLFVPKNYGKTYYVVRFAVWDKVNFTTCCFTFDIKIV
ncbi:uncharacterized protein LOC100572592 [Acyrthosiphon pisum]|uniref:MD-2-related lipid-recognition domain-containing protein n=1 Tax=Acyrthosiphon pisum TaxID=7029 RepID=A0A8R2B4L6_ACYPI|nr:uncharacterized protein LOC100572592 [Acyrthosiphon pisum]|eukprot:XP_008181499.1 PREDICTED: uncharacterized protein LOC100572592 [Acyrthosiphon pisum]